MEIDALPEIQITYKNISELVEYSRNPREHPEFQLDQLAESIKEVGWTYPVLIDKHNIIVCGHGRYQAAQKLGVERIPTIQKADLTETQIKAYRLQDNQLALNAIWNDDFLTQEINALMDTDYDVSKLGFDASAKAPDYEPDVMPDTNDNFVTEDELAQALDKMNGLGGQDATAKGSVMVACPECSHEFRVYESHFVKR